MNTPEPKRTAKTPSTPMTASKATFFRRQDEENAKQGPVRSSTSHFALRELMQLDDNTMKFFDDNDLDFLSGGVQIPGATQRNTITPFASGSLPKGTEDFSKVRGRASGELSDGFVSSNAQLPSAKAQLPPNGRLTTTNSFKSAELPTTAGSPSAESSHSDSKKESATRRKLSLGWRRSSSKNANHADHKNSASHDAFVLDDKTKAQRRISEMPPPKLPASATWMGDAPALPRPSLDSIHRKSTAASLTTLSTVTSHTDADSLASSTTKSSSQRITQPLLAANPNRSSSWGNIIPSTRSSNIKPTSSGLKPRHGLTPSTISAIVKDKDDLAADDEMRRLSQKRRDVDTAARESEDLRRRAVARTPMAPEKVLQDRNYSLNIFERGEIMDFEKEGIFFTGTKTARKVIGSLAPSPQVSSSDKDKAGNYGYDDERGDYNIVLGDHLAYRYEVVDVLGKGSFGQVVRCVDHKEGGVVAVKIIRNKKRFHQQALVEVGILSRLRDWVSFIAGSNWSRVHQLTPTYRTRKERTRHCPSHLPSISDHIFALLRRVSVSIFTS
jgi:dual specificity tyrosine-phosphorylation-regulated kinase 2/3/4